MVPPSYRRLYPLFALLFACLGVLSAAVLASTLSPAEARAAAPRTTPTPPPTSTPTPCTGWQMVYTDYISTTTNYLRGVAALTVNDAWTVGFYNDDSGAGRTFTEHWDGTDWSVIPSPNTPTRNNTLLAVSMLSSNDVWAVGGQGDASGNWRPLAEHWDGSSWTVISTDTMTGTGGFFNAVVALAPDDVWAVGHQDRSPGNSAWKTLVAHWDGTAWSTVLDPGAAMAPSVLYGITAVSANEIWAVGQGYVASSNQYVTLIERWDGDTWSVVPSPTVGTVANNLLSVSGTSANDVWAVGWTGGNVLVEHWDGTQWSLAPVPPYGGALDGVVALAPDNVWAVGTGVDNRSLILHWDGSNWISVDHPQTLYASDFYGIAATSATDVWAVGSYAANSNINQLIEHYSPGAPCITPTPTSTPTATGTPPTSTPTSTPDPCEFWQPVASPTLVGTNSQLEGVYALGPQDAWTVGSYDSGGHRHALAEHWDGQAWSDLSGPFTSTVDVNLQAVSGAATNDVWAVGFQSNTSQGSLPYAQHWDGASWTSVQVPAVVTASYSVFYGVAALSANEAWAVGRFQANTDQGFIEHWDGSSWSIADSSLSWQDTSFLGAVSAVSPNDVWAVGAINPLGTTRADTLTLHWDGNRWSRVPSPNGPSTGNFLYGVAALSANDVWAVGTAGALNRPLVLVEHWDGTAWSVVPVPVSVGVMMAVTAVSSNDVWVVGNTDRNGSGPAITLHWDGAAWSTPPVFPVGSNNPIWGVSADGSGSVWTVGSSLGNGYDQMIQRYRNTCATATPTSTPTALPSDTPTATPTGVPQSTATATPTAVATASVTTTPTACAIAFSDVQPGDYFYEAVRYLYCQGAISGYADGTFRPYNNTTRGQLSKIVVLAEGWGLYVPPQPTFRDVPVDSPFYAYVETAHKYEVVSGYADNTFRPSNNVTRAQLCKIVVLAEHWPIIAPPEPTFIDVPVDNPFYGYIETAYAHGIISGYADGTFRPGNNATRGQISKIVYGAVTAP